jgi:hypothetical protein
VSRDDLISKTGEVLDLLVQKRYDDLESLTSGVRLNKNDIASAISTYGRCLVIPPPEGLRLLDIIEVRNSNPRRWSVVMPLWTIEEGRSDLSLELSLIEKDKTLKVELDDIHVL